MAGKALSRDEAVKANYSANALDAVTRGENTWPNWRQADLIEQVLRVNRHGITATDLRRVGRLEYLKVKFLVPTEEHHVRLGQPQTVKKQKYQFYGLNTQLAEKVKVKELLKWASDKPAPAELDDMVENLTGKLFYRNRR